MLLMVLVFTFVVVVDRIAKSIITARLQEGAFTSAGVLGVRLTHLVNRRRPWGSTTAVRVMSIVWLVLGIAVVTVASLIGSPSTFVALGALLGGAMGNLIDGVSRNGVTDFIDLRVWPVFNVADAAITVGAIMLLWNIITPHSGL